MSTNFNADGILVIPNAEVAQYPLPVSDEVIVAGEEAARLGEVITQMNRFSSLMGSIAQSTRYPELLIAEVLKELGVADITIGPDPPDNPARGHIFVRTGQGSDVAQATRFNGAEFVSTASAIGLANGIAGQIPTLNIV